MKNIIAILFVLVSVTSFNAQIAIGKETVDGAGILDFASGTTNGIILPIVEILPTNAENGTFLMLKEEGIIKVRQNDAWLDLSDAGSIDNITFSTDIESGNGVIIGATSTTAEGVLVLEASDKALILPKVQEPHLNIKSPYPGMMCYDIDSQTLAVFDGLKWNYWK